MPRISAHVLIWFAVLGLWVAASTNHHPTLLINVLATSVLVGASATAVYVNAALLWPRFLRRRSGWRYGLELLGLVSAMDVAAVLIIQALYDGLWGPDPSRYGLGTNLLYEAIFIGLHLGVATAVLALARRSVAKA